MNWSVRPATDLSLLEQSVEHARLALGCPFSSSAEFEADLIAKRRAAGFYGPKMHQRALFGCAAAGLLLVAFLFG
ncbi:MAG: hypothetical protein AB7K04_06205 [Pseudorhodoplanes sp.]